MIVIFHWFSNFLYSYMHKLFSKNLDTLQLHSNCRPLAQRDAENDIKFDPPMFKQRYERATEILMSDKWKNQINKLVDFGCAEFGLFVFLKNTMQMREQVFVDVDELLLRDNLYRVYPLNADHLMRRPQALTVKVFAGSIADPDPSLLGTDAVVALEIIEHLYPDVLDALPYNVFGYIEPKIVIATTPNADFNVLFDKVNKFRHPDHKFEWTREQFRAWATNVTTRFPNYTVQFDDVGLGPHGSEHLGCCSQLALFIRKDTICDNYVKEIIPCACTTGICTCSSSSYGICTYYTYSKKLFDKSSDQEHGFYKLVVTIEYPQYVDLRTEQEQFFDELKYRMHTFETYNGGCYNSEKNRCEIPLKRLSYKTLGPFPSEEEIKDLLLKFNYRIEECFNEETNLVETCVIYEPDMDNGASGSDTEASGYGSDKPLVEDSQVSDWDIDDKEVTPKGPLYDSGYQKSPTADESPPASTHDAIPLEFKGERPNRLSNILSVFDNFDRVNELDAVRKDKKYFSFSSNLPHREMMKKICQEIGRHPVAGPSRDPKRTKMRKSQSSDSDDSVDEVKSITTCILENSLNRIEVQDEERHRGHLIRELIPEEHLVVLEEVVEPMPLVENGDLANNNRDLEGNNVENPQLLLDVDDDVDNVDNVNIDNNNDVEEVAAIPVEELIEDVVEQDAEGDSLVDIEVAWSSREALFDVNSQVDLLDDFDMDPSLQAVNDPVLLQDESGFPNWLLQIFEDGEAVIPEENLHDEPHFYCQGDGLGVHPSTAAINDDDEGNESDTDTSTSGSVDFASAENRSMQELLIPPDVRQDDGLALVGQQLVAPEPTQEAQTSESNLVTSSCTN